MPLGKSPNLSELQCLWLKTEYFVTGLLPGFNEIIHENHFTQLLTQGIYPLLNASLIIYKEVSVFIVMNSY